LSYALPTALPVENIYPDLPADNFCLTEISRIEKEISGEVEHYRLVLKKYKKARKAVHYSAVGLGAVAAALSSGAIAAFLTGVGVIVGAPVAGLRLPLVPLQQALPFSTRSLTTKSINTLVSSLLQLRSMIRLTAVSRRQ